MERFLKMCSFDQTQKPRSWKITAKGNPALAPLKNFGSHYDTDYAISSGCHAKVAHKCHAGRQRMFGYARQTGSFLLPRGHLQYRWNSAFWTWMPGRTFSHKVSWLMSGFKVMTTTLLGTKCDTETWQGDSSNSIVAHNHLWRDLIPSPGLPEDRSLIYIK